MKVQEMRLVLTTAALQSVLTVAILLFVDSYQLKQAKTVETPEKPEIVTLEKARKEAAPITYRTSPENWKELKAPELEVVSPNPYVPGGTQEGELVLEFHICQ